MQKPPTIDHPSKNKWKKSCLQHKKSKKAETHFNPEQVVEMGEFVLPKDAKLKVNEDVVVKDILLQTD